MEKMKSKMSQMEDLMKEFWTCPKCGKLNHYCIAECCDIRYCLFNDHFMTHEELVPSTAPGSTKKGSKMLCSCKKPIILSDK